MREYKTIPIETNQGWGGAQGSINPGTIDKILNEMAAKGWELDCVQDLKHTAGSGVLLCIFKREIPKGADLSS